MKKAKILNKVTEINKFYLEKFIEKGDIVVDATMGNGYDTVFLSKLVGECGKVYSFDVQKEALKSTAKKIEKENLKNVELILDGHENILKYVKEEISCVVFNLGYLPRGDHNLITKPQTTIKAIKDSLSLLKENGLISICIYSGHSGGEEEKDAVYEFCKNLDQNEFNVFKNKFINQVNNPPELILIEKKGFLN